MFMDSESDDSPEMDEAHRLKATHVPLFVALCVEALFCFLMTRFIIEDDQHTSPMESFFIAPEEDFLMLIWLVFLVAAAGRLLCLAWSHIEILRRRRGRLSAVLFMIFGTVHWSILLTAYYIEYDAASPVEKSHKVNLKIDAVPVYVTREHGPAFTECLIRNEWRYEACDLKLDTVCELPFYANESHTLGRCVSHVLVGSTPCCITETITMGRPRMTVFGQSCQANLVFTTLKWAVVLLIGWVLRHGYLVSGLGTKSFSKGAWLDILDAILFSENLSSDCIRFPAYGFSTSGQPQWPDYRPLLALYLTWLAAFLLVMFSQILYAAVAPYHGEQAAEASPPSPAAPLMPVEDGAPEEGSIGFPVCVMDFQGEGSDSDDGCLRRTCSSLLTQTFRPGRAIPAGAGCYRMEFTDDREPPVAMVQADQLYPHFSDRLYPHLSLKLELDEAVCAADSLEDEMEEQSAKICSGWLRCGEMCEGEERELFERRAQVLDALRSLLFLQLPFLLWRLWFSSFTVDVVSWAGSTLLIAKNTIWALLDLTIVLSCGREDSMLCGSRPLQHLRAATVSPFGQVWVGPSGIIACAAEMAGTTRKARLEQKHLKLLQHEEWLRAEKQKWSDAGHLFDEPLRRARHLRVMYEEKMQFTFP